jgi:sugar transferase (PEP-CTERM/EpsH1 system associated)
VNVLFLSHRVPYAPNRGDRVRAFHVLRELTRWADVDVAALAHDDDEALRAPDFAGVARRVVIARVPKFSNVARAALALPTSTPTTHSLLACPELARGVEALTAERRPDVVLCFCTGIAPLVFGRALAGIPVVLDMVDVDSEKWAALASSASPPRSWIYAREARVLRAFERDAVRRAPATLGVNDRERSALQSIVPDARILAIPNGVDVETLRPTGPPSADPVVVFCGVMNYAPNVEGVLWLAREVWPQVLARHPAARLKIVGASPSGEVRALADAHRHIEVTGSVPDVRPHLWGAAVSVAPLQTSRGVQNKVLEAVAAGLPAIVTTVVMDGLPAGIRSACTVVDSQEAFAGAIGAWLDRGADERRLAAAVADTESLTWPRQLASLRGILESAAGSGLPPT